ncbi:sorting nexin-32 isoform X1 [Sigmodon hispidus]
MRNREVRRAENHHQLCCQHFEHFQTLPGRMSPEAWHGHTVTSTLTNCPVSLFSPELTDLKSRRVSSSHKNLIELAELELKHAKVSTRCPSHSHELLPLLLPLLLTSQEGVGNAKGAGYSQA